MDVRGHHLEEAEDKCLRCTRCLREWSRLRTSQRWCPGVPWYTYGCAPDHLYTYTQLKAKGLRPRDRRERAGYIVTAFHDGVSLYNIRDAQPRRVETERQREARLAAWPRIQEKYKCAHCGYVPESLADIRCEMFKAGLCLGCKERLEWQAEQDALFAQMAEDRRDVCAWAYHLLRRSDWALIDTETTSLAGVVCEIAVIAGDGSILFHSLVNPEYPVSDGAREIHGISDAELAAAPTLPEIWPQLQEALRDRGILVAYNASFDRARLAQSASRYHLEAFTQGWECVMEAYAAYCGNWSDYHGDYTWIPLQSSHRAVGDARAALECLCEMAAVYEREYASPTEGEQS
jgi:DNA polymerase III epsilon subunit-like protein